MTTQPKQSQSIFPDIPRDRPAVNKDGNFSQTWSLGFSNLFQALQKNFKNEGIVFPPLSPSQQSTIQGLYTSYIGGNYSTLVQNLPDISGQTIFDDTNYLTKQFVIAQDNASPSKVLLAEWVPFAMMLFNAGNPNGSVAGVSGWFCYDTTNKVLYICTTTGSTTTAVWTAV
jgi:hypothetical protein